jgi:hypothetical protein
MPLLDLITGNFLLQGSCQISQNNHNCAEPLGLTPFSNIVFFSRMPGLPGYRYIFT